MTAVELESKIEQFCCHSGLGLSKVLADGKPVEKIVAGDDGTINIITESGAKNDRHK